MKSMLLVSLVLFSVSLFASEDQIDLSGFRKLDSSEIADLRDALISANKGSSTYGACGLRFSDEVAVYINNNGISPLVIIMNDKHFLKLDSNEAKTKIVRGVRGEWEIARGNMGTITNPVFKLINRITSVTSCK